MRKVLFMGDSLTYGFDPRGAFGGRYPESVRWTDTLSARMIKEWEIKTAAEPGREIPETPFEIEAAHELISSFMPFDLLAVMLGLNDYLNMYQPDIVEVTGRMKRFLEDVRAMDSFIMHDVKILLIAPPAIHTAQDDFYGKYDTTNGIFSKAYKALAEHLGVFFADAKAWNLPPAFDGIHLSEEGNRLFADRMEETLNHIALRLSVDPEDAV